MLTKAHVTALKQDVAECEICVQVGRPTPSREVSPIRVIAEFNQTVHIYFMFITIRDTSVVILHIFDSATAFSVAVVVPSRDLSHAANRLEEQWIAFTVHPLPSPLIQSSLVVTSRTF
jgi:hypothetical protein